MDDALLLRTLAAVRGHPWWQARARLALQLLAQFGLRRDACVLDAGCGWGVTLDAIEQAGYTAVGLDASRQVLEQIDRPERRLIHADLSRAMLSQERFDAVLALDVIEHIDDDVDALARLATLARPHAPLILSVPALPRLFSEFDTIQGHRRRYSMALLTQALQQAGLTIDRAFYWGGWLVPMLQLQRSRPKARPGDTNADIYLRYLKPPARWIQPFLRLAFAVDERLALASLLPAGTSLVAVVRSKGTSGAGRAISASTIDASASAISA